MDFLVVVKTGFEKARFSPYGPHQTMCTLVIAARVVPGFPLVIVANRDENKARLSSPPSRWPGFVAPRDEVAHGTWLGLNDAGVFVGITNRFLGPREMSRRSRGAIVVDALRAGSTAREIHAAMAKLDPLQFNGFHLVCVDDRDVLATVSDGSVLQQLALGDGLAVVTERSFGAGDDGARVQKVRAAWDALAPFDRHRATKLLTDHDVNDPLAATCIHLDAADYGTRSAMVLTKSGSAAGVFEMLWAEGPPCVTPFHPVTLAGAD